MCVVAAGSLVCGLAAAPPALAAAARAATPGSTGTPASPGSGPRVYQTPGQALAQAARTGKAVPVTGATSPTSTLTANPDGTFTLTESAAPVRTRVDGTWRDLNPDLARNAGGTYSPAVSTSPLVLSGGGTGPLATMSDGGYSLSLTAPVRLPAPAVSGPTATYAGILPGVDLIVTAKPSGGYSEAIRVDTPAAAASPALASLTFTTQARGLTVQAARNGVLTARTSRGQVIFAAPAPRMWDSAVAPPVTPAAASGAGRPATRDGRPVTSTAAFPGMGAHTASVGVAIHGSRLTLAPGHALLAARSAVFPEYIDPSWDTSGASAANWAYVSTEFPSQPYYDGSGYLQAGEQPASDGSNNDTGYHSYAFYQLPISTVIRGAYINSATAYFPEVWADSCTPSPVDLYQTGAISSSTTYNNQPSWGAKLGSDDVAYGWSPSGIGGSSSCPSGAKDVSYSVKSVIAADAATTSGSMPALNVGLRAESSGVVGWKLFANPRTQVAANATLTIQYAFAPSTPSLHTSPAADCSTGTTVLGNGNVLLDAGVYDKDGGTLSVTYAAYADGTSSDTFATNPTMTVSAGSGTTATLELSASDLQTADTKYGSSGVVPITWTATVSTGLSGVPTSSATCKFTFSTAKPGAPDITDPSGNECGTGTQAYTVGTPVTFTVTADTNSGAAAPTSYSFQLNGGNPVPFAAGSTSPYQGRFPVAPTRQTNVITIVATAAGGNIGDDATCYFYATTPSPAADQDLTGDGIPDLLTAGNGTTGTASGLWLAAGQGSGGRFDGTVATTATDIGPFGPQGLGTSSGATNPGTPADWNGLKAISGQFLGPGFNAVEAYAPGTPDAYLIPTQGDGSAAANVQAFTSQDNNLTSAGTFVDTSQASGDANNPLQLADAYHVSASGEPYPDEIGVYNDTSPAVGAYLAYFQADDGAGGFDSADGNDLGLPYELSNATPDGTMDWAGWTITTDSDTRGGTSYTDMYLWNQSSGALYLWELTGLTGQMPGGFNYTTFTNSNPTATLAYTQTELSPNWNKGTSLATLQGTDINGEPGLVDVTSAGQVQSWALNGTSPTQVNATGATQKLLTADHAYLLDDVTDDGATVSTATDQPGAGDTEDDLSGNSGTTWNSGDMFSPDVTFDGKTGFLASSSQAGDFSPNHSFTVSAWVNPAALGGTVFSQNGSDYSTVKVSTTSSGQWSMAMNASGSSYVTATGGTARAGLWTSVTLTFDTANGDDILKLYANGTEVAYLADTSPPATTGRFLIGASQAASSATSFLSGQVADVQAWDSLATPVQPPSPASVLVPVTPVRIMDTRPATKIGSVTGPVAVGATITVPIAGTTVNGASIPSSGVTAVAASVTVTGGAATGYMTAYPDGAPRPVSSTVNCDSAGDTITNDAIVPVGGDGKIDIHNGCGGTTTQVIIDVTGYLTSNTTATGHSTYTPLADPTRIFYTGNGTGLPNSNPVAAAGKLVVPIAGNNTNGAGIPSTGVTAVALNIGALAPSGDAGYIAAFPDGTSPAEETSVSFTGPETYQDTVIVPVGSDGKIDIYNGSTKAIDVAGDLSGYFTTSTSGNYYHALDATRITDTRQASPIAADGTLTVADPASVVADDPTLVLNITVPSPAASGYLKAYPGTQPAPGTSVITFAPSQVIAGLALASTATQNTFNIYNASSGATNVVLDTDGYFQ